MAPGRLEAMAKKRSESDSQRHIVALLAMGMVGLFLWWQLFRLVTGTPPTRANLLLAFGFLFLATAATGGLVSWLLHRRLDRAPPLLTLLRQGTWAGLLLLLYAWLTLLDNLTWFIAILLFALLASIEMLILLRESRS